MSELNFTSRPKIFERNIDDLLERLLLANAHFAANFIAAVAAEVRLRMIYDSLSIERQAPHSGVPGSIDLLICLHDAADNAETGRLLVENKLDSGFTPNQPERYAASGMAMSRAGRPAIPVICAPAQYLARSKHTNPFKARISYETLASWVTNEEKEQLDAAIARFEMPYEPDPVPAVAEFFDGYVHLAREHAPELIIKSNPNSGGARPEGSRTIYFATSRSLPQYDFLPALRFSHQCWDSSASAPSVKVMFANWSRFETLLQRASAADLSNTPLYLRAAGNSLGLVHDTPRMDNKRAVGTQLEAVVRGIRAAAAIRAWMYANEKVLRRWASLVLLPTEGISSKI